MLKTIWIILTIHLWTLKKVIKNIIWTKKLSKEFKANQMYFDRKNFKTRMNHYIPGLESKRTKTRGLETFIISFCKKCIKTFL
jgi:hypothetical protein